MKTQFLCEALCETLNSDWKVDAIESGHPGYPQLEIEEGRRYLKIWKSTSYESGASARSCWMFVDKETGACYKPASHKAPAKGIRFYINQLADAPETCDRYGNFLYLR